MARARRQSKRNTGGAQRYLALGKEVAKGVGREIGSMGVDILKEGVHLIVDLLAGLVTLGAAGSVSPTIGKARRDRRRRR